MLLEDKIKITISPRSFDYYSYLGYRFKGVGDEITIKTTDLPTQSKHKVAVVCDVCGSGKTERKEIRYTNYLKNITNGGYYSCCATCSLEKSKKTFLKNSGYEYANQSPEARQNLREKQNIIWNNPDYVEKMQNLCIDKYGVDSFMKTQEFRDKSDVTNLEKYGNVRPMKNPDMIEKLKQTNLEKYGYTIPLLNKDIIYKSDLTKIRLYNDKNYNNREQYKQTCLDKFGFDNSMKNPEIAKKLQESFFEKYGVTHPSQVPEFYEKCLQSGLKINRYKETEIYYQSSYELDFLEKYSDKYEIVRGMMFSYEHDGRNHVYFSDFYIAELNLVVEIKSKYWYESQLDKCESKQKSCIDYGYDFIFIINKDYSEFNEKINNTRFH